MRRMLAVLLVAAGWAGVAGAQEDAATAPRGRFVIQTEIYSSHVVRARAIVVDGTGPTYFSPLFHLYFCPASGKPCFAPGLALTDDPAVVTFPTQRRGTYILDAGQPGFGIDRAYYRVGKF